MYKKEVDLARQRNANLKEQCADLIYQKSLINEKLLEKADEYHCSLNEVEEDLEEKKEQVKELERDCAFDRQREHEIKIRRGREIQALKERIKKADDYLQVYKEQNDKVCNTEKQRI